MKQGTPLIRLKGADLPYLENLLLFWLRACLKKAFCKMCVTICGRFCPDEGAVAGYGNRIRAKYTAKWGVQIAGMIFQTGSNLHILLYMRSDTERLFKQTPDPLHQGSA